MSFQYFISDKIKQFQEEKDKKKQIDTLVEIYQYIFEHIDEIKKYPLFYITIRNNLYQQLSDVDKEQYSTQYKILNNFYNTLFKTYINNEQSKYVKEQIEEHLIPDLTNISLDYLSNDRCSMLTEEGDRCAYKNEYIKVVDGTEYKEDCKFYCSNHYMESFERIINTQPEIVNLSSDNFDQDYLIIDWWITRSNNIDKHDHYTKLNNYFDVPIIIDEFVRTTNRYHTFHIKIFTALKGTRFPQTTDVKVSFPDYSNFGLEDLIEPSNKEIINKRWISSSKWKYDPENKKVYLKYTLSKI